MGYLEGATDPARGAVFVPTVNGEDSVEPTCGGDIEVARPMDRARRTGTVSEYA